MKKCQQASAEISERKGYYEKEPKDDGSFFLNAETVLECLAEGVAAKELSTKRNSAILRDVADVHA